MGNSSLSYAWFMFGQFQCVMPKSAICHQEIRLFFLVPDPLSTNYYLIVFYHWNEGKKYFWYPTYIYQEMCHLWGKALCRHLLLGEVFQSDTHQHAFICLHSPCRATPFISVNLEHQTGIFSYCVQPVPPLLLTGMTNGWVDKGSIGCKGPWLPVEGPLIKKSKVCLTLL